MIEVGDTVWVNEETLSGKPLKHEWYGKVITIEGAKIRVKDTTEGSHKGIIYIRWLGNLELKEPNNYQK